VVSTEVLPGTPVSKVAAWACSILGSGLTVQDGSASKAPDNRTTGNDLAKSEFIAISKWVSSDLYAVKLRSPPVRAYWT